MNIPRDVIVTISVPVRLDDKQALTLYNMCKLEDSYPRSYRMNSLASDIVKDTYNFDVLLSDICLELLDNYSQFYYNDGKVIDLRKKEKE